MPSVTLNQALLFSSLAESVIRGLLIWPRSARESLTRRSGGYSGIAGCPGAGRGVPVRYLSHSPQVGRALSRSINSC